METVVGLTAIAVALLIGLGAWVPPSVSVCWVASSWKAQLVSLKWFRCCR